MISLSPDEADTVLPRSDVLSEAHLLFAATFSSNWSSNKLERPILYKGRVLKYYLELEVDATGHAMLIGKDRVTPYKERSEAWNAARAAYLQTCDQAALAEEFDEFRLKNESPQARHLQGQGFLRLASRRDAGLGLFLICKRHPRLRDWAHSTPSGHGNLLTPTMLIMNLID